MGDIILMEKENMLQKIAQVCDDKQAENIIALDMQHVSLVADYFLICHASNQKKVQAIAKAVQDVIQAHDNQIHHVEGIDQGRWVIIDTGHVLCHIFQEEERSFYHLERLWGDADKVPLQLGEVN